MVGFRAARDLCSSIRDWQIALHIIAIVLTVFARTEGVALAQAPQQNALARTLFEEGVALADHGDYVGAADRFSRAHSLRPTSGIAFNWASVLIEIGQLLQAQDLLLGVARDPAADAQLRAESETMLDTITPLVARLRVRLSGEVDDKIHVEVDGADWPRAAWDIASPIDPGSHAVVLRRGEHELAEHHTELAEGESRDVVLQIPKETPAPAWPPSSAATDAETSSGRPLYRNWMVWTAVGAVVVGGVVAGVVMATRKDAKDEEPVIGNATPGVLTW